MSFFRTKRSRTAGGGGGSRSKVRVSGFATDNPMFRPSSSSQLMRGGDSVVARTTQASPRLAPAAAHPNKTTLLGRLRRNKSGRKYSGIELVDADGLRSQYAPRPPPPTSRSPKSQLNNQEEGEESDEEDDSDEDSDSSNEQMVFGGAAPVRFSLRASYQAPVQQGRVLLNPAPSIAETSEYTGAGADVDIADEEDYKAREAGVDETDMNIPPVPNSRRPSPATPSSSSPTPPPSRGATGGEMRHAAHSPPAPKPKSGLRASLSRMIARPPPPHPDGNSNATERNFEPRPPPRPKGASESAVSPPRAPPSRNRPPPPRPLSKGMPVTNRDMRRAPPPRPLSKGMPVTERDMRDAPPPRPLSKGMPVTEKDMRGGGEKGGNRRDSRDSVSRRSSINVRNLSFRSEEYDRDMRGLNSAQRNSIRELAHFCRELTDKAKYDSDGVSATDLEEIARAISVAGQRGVPRDSPVLLDAKDLEKRLRVQLRAQKEIAKAIENEDMDELHAVIERARARGVELKISLMDVMTKREDRQGGKKKKKKKKNHKNEKSSKARSHRR